MDVSKKELSGRLGGMSLGRQVFVLAVWPFWEGVLSWGIGTVDLAIAGRLDESQKVAALDALGASTYVGWLMSMIFAAVGMGGAALIARAIGGGHRRLANAALGQSMMLSVLVGVLFGVVLYTLAEFFGRSVGLTDEGLEFCVLYLRVIAFSGPFCAVLLVGNAALRASGDTRSPFMVMVVADGVNVVVSGVLVFGPGAIGGHGVGGIAMGTVAAWGVGSVLTVGLLFRGGKSGRGEEGVKRGTGMRLRVARMRPHWHTIKRVLKVSVPGAIESIFAMWLANYFVLMLVGKLAAGNEGIQGAHIVAIRIESISFLPGFALGVAGATLAGQYLGLGDVGRAKRAAWTCLGVGAVLMTGLGLVFIAVPEFLVRMITDAEPTLEYSPTLLRICGVIQLPFACYIVLSSVLRGVGDTRVTLWMTAGSSFLVRLPAAYLLGEVMGYGLVGVWVGLCGELMFRGALFLGRFLQGGWAELEV